MTPDRGRPARGCTGSPPTSSGGTAGPRNGPYRTLKRASAETGDPDVLLLVAYGDLSYEEVAQALGIRAGTVGSRLNRVQVRETSSAMTIGPYLVRGPAKPCDPVPISSR